MRWLQEALAGNPRSCPSAIEPRQPHLIKQEETRAPCNSAQQPPMDCGENDKERDRKQYQQVSPAEVAQPNKQPDHRQPGKGQLQVANPPLAILQLCVFRGQLCQTP